MSAPVYGFFACYAVTGKCDLRIDSKARDVPVFSSLEDCQRFGSDAAKQQPDKQGNYGQHHQHFDKRKPAVTSSRSNGHAKPPVDRIL